MLTGNLGRAVVKISAVKAEHRLLRRHAGFSPRKKTWSRRSRPGELHRDVVCVVRFQGPKANGMPELHKLTPALGVLQDLGFKVALLTDGRMSGASGKVPAAIHVTPEALSGGPIGAFCRTAISSASTVSRAPWTSSWIPEFWRQRVAPTRPTVSNHWGYGP